MKGVTKIILIGILTTLLITPAISADDGSVNNGSSDQPFILILMQQGNGNPVFLSQSGSYQVERGKEVNFTVTYIWLKPGLATSSNSKTSIQNPEQLFEKYKDNILEAISNCQNKKTSKLDLQLSSYQNPPDGNWGVYINTSNGNNIPLGNGDQSDLYWLEVSGLLIGLALPGKQLNPYIPTDPVGSTFNITAKWNETTAEKSLTIENIAIVPEPTTFIITAFGLFILLGFLYKKKEE